ncbi:LamG-like jellyroll fold domain-containing protein [Flavobacterium sp. AED]|uniref:LamG-like jellyroll fold domain-containing protein n=1 Tax=Flavobacterium sp. AED TaxID=1423323 RepID=UPI00068A5A89|nr:LamG-like jellyroll fold domain-containing protein [Flavobacterium sp. AED]
MNRTILFTKKIFLALAFLFITSVGFSQSPKTYSSSGTFTVPAGITSVTAQVWGGGGKGSTRGTNGNGGGGGGGAYASQAVTVDALNPTYTVTVGTGSTTTADGLDSWFSTAGTVLAKGGKSQADNTPGGAVGGLASTSIGTTKWNGGTGVTGAVAYGGGGGSSAGTGAVGVTGLLSAGGVAPAGGGNGGDGKNTTQGDGSPGVVPGGGGGGGYRTSNGTRNGGNGADGRVILTWTCPAAGYSLTGTSIASPLCNTNGAVVTLTGGTGLPTGNYTVTYTLTGTNAATNATATMSVTTAGTGSFTTTALANVGLTNIQITNLSSGVSPDNCTSAISSGNTASVTLTTVPNQPSTITGNTSSCLNTSQTYSVTAVAGVTYTWSFPAGWVQTAGTTTNSITVTTSSTAGNVSVTPSNNCGNGTARTLAITITTPTANAGSALSAICQGATSAALGGSFGGTATAAIWSDGGTGGTFTNNTGSTPNTTTWTPPSTYSGTATLTLITSGGSCGTTTASKTQVVNPGPTTATVGSFQTIYASFVSTSLGGNTPSIGSGAWSKISGPGTATFSAGTSGTSTATVTLNGAYVFRWTITGTCGSSSDDITVTYLPFKDPEYTILYENFDNSNGSWTSSGTTGVWGYTNTASSVHRGEGNFWAVNTTSNLYPNSALTYLTSPAVSTTGYTNVKLFIDVRYDTNNDTDDGMQLQYSTDNGSTWSVLGAGSTSFYNATNVNALSASLTNTDGWNNDSYSYSPSKSSTVYSQFREKSIQTSVLDNKATLKFRAVFASDGSNQDSGVAIDNFIIKGDPTIAFTDPVSGPGSINSNLKLWLKSNTGTNTTTDGTSLGTWSDQAFNNNSVGITGNSPVFRNNATRNINFNPVVDFTAASSQLMKGKGGFWSQDYYVVVKTNGVINNSAASRQVPISGRLSVDSFEVDGTALGLGDFTARYTDEMVSHNINSIPDSPPTLTKSYGRAYKSSTDSYNQQTIIFNIKTNSSGTASEIYKNGKRIDNTTGLATDNGTLNFSEFNNLQYNLGVGRFTLGGNVGSYLDGRMTEIVSYSAPKSVLEQQKIQSYLAIKNGVTLHDTGSTTADDLCDANYVDSSGNTIWDATANTGYNYDIAGIGRDDSTLLNQKQSKTENPTSDISVGLGDLLDVNTNNTNTFDTNQKYLVWGNNHGTLAAQTPVIVNISSGITSPSTLTSDVSFVSVGRTWKVVETGGNVGTAKVSIPATMLTATITPPGDYLMFISDTPVFNPTAEYRIMTVNGSNLETTYDFDGTKYVTFGYAPEKTFVRCIKFDGVNDYLDAGKVLDLNTSFTVSAWVNRNSVNQTILSKRDSGFSQGYDLSINAAGKAEMSWYVGVAKKTITSNVVIPSGYWHHIGVTFDGTTAKMYIDGVNKISTAAGVPTATTQSFLVAAADGVTPTSFFNGSIDEVRVWDVALTDAQFRYVINQEILSNGTLTNGAIIPNTITLNNISSIPWANLKAYYPMSTYTYTNAKDISNNHYTAALRNLTTVDLQTAPLPYESAANGNWQTIGTWTNSTLQDLPNSSSIEDNTKTIDWNIVKSSHTITSTGNKTVLGLFVNSNTLTATSASGLQTDGTKIEVSHYLKLDGKIDLVGRSQLVQTEGSDLDVTSAGSIEKDQQGQSNKFNYNYWSSPVSPISTTANNTNYTVGGVLKDGTNPAVPVNINWVTGYDGSATTPISLAKYWIYKFDNAANLYANWNQIFETGTIPVGQGFTLKGSGAATATQNLTFTGKPNNGTITRTVGATQLLLVGNPYSSALDANAFITDNSGSIDTTTPTATDGALYFWEHYTGNGTHILSGYQGGYAVRNAAAGVAPSSVGVDFISTSGTSLRAAPNQYIPVGQGFFVIGNATGGTVTFKNSQRAFVKEDNAASQTMYRIPTKPKGLDHWTDNSDDQIEKDTYKRVRLGFNNYNEVFHRQVVVAFMDEKANSEINEGYDAENIDDVDTDMYLVNSDKELIIEGEGYFNEDASYPIGVRSNAAGKVSFVLDGLENFDDSQSIFIYDKSDDTYHNIKDALYEVELPEGTIDDRFYLRFTDKTLSVKDQVYENAIQVDYIRSTSILTIINNSKDNTVNTVSLFNIEGKSISKWDIKDKDQTNIKLPIQSIASGVYIVKLKTLKGTISKKIIIK